MDCHYDGFFIRNARNEIVGKIRKHDGPTGLPRTRDEYYNLYIQGCSSTDMSYIGYQTFEKCLEVAERIIELKGVA